MMVSSAFDMPSSNKQSLRIFLHAERPFTHLMIRFTASAVFADQCGVGEDQTSFKALR